MTNGVLVTGKQLGQALPADTNAVSLYSPGANVVAEITGLVVAVVTATSPTFRVFHDDNGTTYSTATALFYDAVARPNIAIYADATSYIPFDPPIWMADATGNLAVRTSAASEINFTLYGIEHED